MGSDEQAFLRAICAAPADDTPRLVFADWLDEQGREERAELIRVQCELAAMPDPPREPERGESPDVTLSLLEERQAWRKKWSPRYYELRKRIGNLLAGYRMLWLEELAGRLVGGPGVPVLSMAATLAATLAAHPILMVVASGEFRRGFPVVFSVSTLAVWAEYADRLRVAAPVEEVRLGEWPEPRRERGVYEDWFWQQVEANSIVADVLGRSMLPDAVFGRLVAGRRGLTNSRRYDSRALALADLDRALAAAYPGVRFVLSEPEPANPPAGRWPRFTERPAG